MTRRYLLFIPPCVLLSHPTFADKAAMQSHSQGGVSFISEGTGEYLSDVKVTITNTLGNVFLDTAADDSKLFANLKARRYIVQLSRWASRS